MIEFPLWPSVMGVVNQIEEEFLDNTFVADLQAMFLQHARIDAATAAAQALVIPVYIGAAIAAAENTTLRDVRPRQRTWEVLGAPKFEFRRGAWSSVGLLVDGTEVVTDDIVIVGDAGPKSWGFSVLSPSTNYVVTATTGYPTLADVPIDMVSFILSAAAWQYEMREVATYSSMIQHADVIPLYLLDPWTIPSYA